MSALYASFSTELIREILQSKISATLCFAQGASALSGSSRAGSTHKRLCRLWPPCRLRQGAVACEQFVLSSEFRAGSGLVGTVVELAVAEQLANDLVRYVWWFRQAQPPQVQQPHLILFAKSCGFFRKSPI